ncbi:glycosyltransferase family 2 protein [Neolewinella lacunae]|uniref:Glycosyltransferase family 2 protein n=1 Tax=Neolewinella lacunae TaxID=1517758 RepID=A0A923TF36_9BACT|nr:glycosyltransferase family 2 protein [Neolewinella lacunae]MBC6996582.1 glycosyltransferase family 2 protein [Neolewinella lacunae]MDN3634854.1 glycosyltransferase family 2 protein [Neolewinella lacunae]
MNVSVIIPAYNAAPFLARAIDSVLAQEYPVAQLILVDNNSVDGTLAIMHSYQQRYPQRILVAQCKRQGVSAARNRGLALATGEWVQFLDADDTLDPRKLSAQLALVQPRTEWIIGGYRNAYADGSTLNNIPHPDPWRGLVFGYRAGCTHANLFRRHVLTSGIAWEESLPDNEDPTLCFALLRAGVRWQVIPEVLCTYHHHPTPGRLSLHDAVGGKAREVALLRAINSHLAATAPAYWQEHAAYFQAALLRALRVQATFDLTGATATFQTCFPQGLTGIDWATQQLLPKVFIQAYQLFGFHRSEAIRLTLSQILPSRLLQRLKPRNPQP